MRKTSIVLVAVLVVSLILSAVVMYPSPAYAGSQKQAETVAAYGEEAQSFALMIANTTGLEVNSKVDKRCVVVVISDLTKIEAAKVVDVLKRGGTLVAMTLPADNGFVEVPMLYETSARTDYLINSTDGTILSTSISQNPDKIIKAEYWITIVQRSSIVRESTYALVTKSQEKSRNILKIAAGQIKEQFMASRSEGMATAMGSFPEASGDWVKKYEASRLWDLPGDDQLYTRYELYSLKWWDSVTQKEYWRIDSYIDHWLPSYVQQTGHCGPYISTRQIIVDGDSCDMYDYDPQTTPTDTTVNVGIGFSISNNGVGFDIGYSWSWLNPGVRYDTSPDYTNSKITWDETFRGPDYTWWPWYGGPTEPSHNSYNAKTTVVMRASLGNGFYGSQLRSRWIEFDDYMSWSIWNPFVWVLSRYYYSYVSPWVPGQLPSIFKHTLKIASYRTTDTYARSHGRAVDRDLPENWWNYQGYEFLSTSQSFTYTEILYLVPGEHFVEYAASGYVPNYAWHGKIYIDNVLIAEGDVGRYSANHLRGYFTT